MTSLSEFGPRVISVLFTLGTNWMCTQHFSNHSVREWGNRIRPSHSDKQLTRSLVTAWEVWAGSTSAAEQTSCRLDELHQESSSLDQHWANTRTHCSCTQHQFTLENHPVYSMEWTIEAEDQGRVEQSLSWRRRQATRSWPRRRKQAGVEPGGEGQARSKPQLNSKQQKLYTAPLLHNYRQR
jgi:hypothetical protein